MQSSRLLNIALVLGAHSAIRQRVDRKDSTQIYQDNNEYGG